MPSPPPKPQPRPIEVNSIPAAMRAAPRWVLWNYVWKVDKNKEAGGKWTKPLYKAQFPDSHAATNNSSTWATFTDAFGKYEDGKCDGIGFCFGDGWSGIDLDHCRNAGTGVVDPEMMSFALELKSYTEASPSGEGLHTITKGTLPQGGRKKGGFEIYDSGRYFTVTGHHIADTPLVVEDRTKELAALHSRIFGVNGSTMDGTVLSRLGRNQTESESNLVSRTPNDTRPGSDFNNRASWRDILEPEGWTWVRSNGDGVRYWCRPGKTGDVSASINYAGLDLLHVFTTSTVFEEGKSIDKFGAYTLLRHGGDFAAAGRALAREGYGQKSKASSSANGSSVATSGGTADDEEQPARHLHLTPASSIKPRPVRWLWEERLPLGALGLLGGREGIGKSILAYTLAADVTRGTLKGDSFGTPRSVIIAATEDSWEYTIVPRLLAAGADCDRIFRVDVTTPDGLETALSLPQDLESLEQAIVENDVALLILDPLLSRLDNSLDTHIDAETRLALEPLVALADRTNAHVLGIIHVNKSSSTDPLSLIMGSRAFVAVARAVLFVMKDPENENIRLLGQPKNNLGQTDLPTLSFRIESHLSTEGEIRTGKLEWLGESTQTLQDAIVTASEDSGSRTATAEATDWLVDFLSSQGGSCASKTVKAKATAAGHNASALRRGREKLKLKSESSGFPRETTWSLPPNFGRGDGDASSCASHGESL